MVFLGNGPTDKVLQQMDIHNVYFHSLVSYSELPIYTSDADIGVATIYGDTFSTFHCLPNKLFEYVQGGLAIIASDLPEMSELIKNHEIGMVFDNNNIESLKTVMNEIIVNSELRSKYKSNSLNASKELNWNIESKKLAKIYNQLLDTKS